MPKTRSGQKEKRALLLDPDKLGLLAASFFGTLVLVLCFWRQLDGIQAAIRVALTALVSYTATSLFVRFPVTWVAKEAAQEQKRRTDEKQRARAEEESAERAREAAPEGTEEEEVTGEGV